MTKSISAEELAGQIVDEIATGLFNHLGGVEVGSPRHVSIDRTAKIITQAIKTATEPLEMEIERLRAEILDDESVVFEVETTIEIDGDGSTVVLLGDVKKKIKALKKEVV